MAEQNPNANIVANVVQARHFQLVDDENEVVAQLGVGPDGSAAIEFYQDGGIPRLGVGVNAHGTAGVDLRDDSGIVRARLAVEPSGTPTVFTIRDAPNRIRAQILLQEDGAVGLTLTNTAGERRAFIEVYENDVALVGLYDKDGNPAAGLHNEVSE